MCVDVDVATEPTFEEWVGTRAPALLRFAYLVTGSQQAAEDALQTALATACEKWGAIRRADDPDLYVRRMIANAHISAWRRFGRRVSPVAEVFGAGAAPDPADRFASDDAVWRVCLGLPAQQRAAVVLRFYEDLDYREIAAVLGVAEATVRSHIHRALTRLRDELERGAHD
jgi:RNA polymerase sigma-70 factor (sigma-E family)